MKEKYPVKMSQKNDSNQSGNEMCGSIKCRKANSNDSRFIAAIWNQGIEDGNATLETRHKDEEWTNNWLLNRDSRYSVLVAHKGREILGWLSLNPFSMREVYRYVADISIYVERKHRGEGIGTGILDCGIMEAKKNGFHKLVLTMIHGNMAAKKLYLNHGFTTVGIMHEQGMLYGNWVHTEIMEKIL